MAAQRPIWRGHLRLALVSCPVALYSANHDRGSLHFHLINPKTGHRIRMVTQDAETEQELSRRDLVKGYEFKKDTYLVLTDEDFEGVAHRQLVDHQNRKIRPLARRSIRSTSMRATTSRRTATPGSTSTSCCATRSPAPARWRWRAW